MSDQENTERQDRLFMFDEGLSLEARTKVVEQKGELTPEESLSKRVASFFSGVAIGGEEFVKRVASRYQEEMGRKRARNPRSLPEGRGGFFVMRE